MGKQKESLTQSPARKNQRILSLDPASLKTGWAYFDGEQLIDYGLLSIKQSLAIEHRLVLIYDEIKKITKKYSPHIILIEDQFLGQNTKTLKVLSWVRGVIMLFAAQNKIELGIISNKTAKLKATGKGNATKLLVAKYVCELYGLHPEDIQEDISDAIAIAVAYLKESE